MNYISKEVVLTGLKIFGVYLAIFLIIATLVLVLGTLLSVWPLFVSASLIALKFAVAFPALPWYASFLVLCVCLRWIFIEVGRLSNLGGSYAIWQGLALLMSAHVRIEYYILIFAVNALVFSIVDQFPDTCAPAKPASSASKAPKKKKVKKD